MRLRRRNAFTLVELLVAMALIVFIMALLSEAFVAGLKTFRDLKAVGDMDQKLRTVRIILTDDLSSDHFTGRLRLSDPNFWNQAPPREGFFSIVQMTAPVAITAPVTTQGYFLEGTDGDGIPSYIASDHRLHFAVKRRGNQKDRFFSALVPNGSTLLTTVTNFDAELAAPDARLQSSTYNSQWAEVGWFLVPTVDGTLGTTGAGPLGVPLFALYRTELPIVPDNSNLNWPGPNPAPPPIAGGTGPTFSPGFGDYQTMSTRLTTDAMGNPMVYFNSPTDVASGPQFRAFDPTNPLVRPGGTGFVQQGTLLMTNVISFHVQVLLNGVGVPATFTDLNSVVPSGSTPPPYVFDTSRPPAPPAAGVPPYTIAALKISIRVWDEKTQQARQVTIIQDM